MIFSSFLLFYLYMAIIWSNNFVYLYNKKKGFSALLFLKFQFNLILFQL